MSSEQQHRENILVEISNESLLKLRDFYQVNWPEHIIAFNYIDTMIKRFKKYPENREIHKIYSINGVVEEDATFISIMVREKNK
jgi:hypothetical protein